MFLNKQSFLVVILKRKKKYVSGIHNCYLVQITVVLQSMDCISILIARTISSVFDSSLNDLDALYSILYFQGNMNLIQKP